MTDSVVVVPECADGLVVDLKVRPGVWISKGQLVAILKRPKGSEGAENLVIRVKAEQAGKVVETLKKNGESVKSG